MTRTCSNCACALEVKHPQLINEKMLMCRRNPPQLIQQRTDKGMVGGLTYSPTAADLVCFDGWRPMGTEPGNNEPPPCVHCGGQHEDFASCADQARPLGSGIEMPSEEEFVRNQTEEPGNLPHG